MKYGLNVPNIDLGGGALTLAELARDAEEAGWDAFLLEDYIVHHSASAAPTCDPWIALAAIALGTEHIRIGTEVTPLSRRRPWKLARETVTLDRLSRGRLILGVGLGDLNDTGLAHVGEVTDPSQRARMLDEGLDVLVGLWSGQSFNYTGRHYQVEAVKFQPTPMQRPRIPIWVGGSWPRHRPLERAARWDGFCVYKATVDGSWADLTPDEVRSIKTSIEAVRSTPTPFDIVLGGRERGTSSEQERALIRSVAEAGGTWWIEYLPAGDVEAMRAWIKRGPLRVDVKETKL